MLRARELFQAADDNGEEKEALEDAMYALRALRKQRSDAARIYTRVLRTESLALADSLS